MLNLESLNCYKFILSKHKTLENFASFFPSYFFEFENDFVFEWKPINYLTLALNTTDYYCLPILELPGCIEIIKFINRISINIRLSLDEKLGYRI